MLSIFRQACRGIVRALKKAPARTELVKHGRGARVRTIETIPGQTEIARTIREIVRPPNESEPYGGNGQHTQSGRAMRCRQTGNSAAPGPGLTPFDRSTDFDTAGAGRYPV